MAKELTARQKQVLDFIKKEAESGVTPTFKQIADAFGFSSKAARDHVNALIKKNHLGNMTEGSRKISLEVVEPKVVSSIAIKGIANLTGVSESERHIFEVPIYRRVSISEPFLRDRDIQGVVPVLLSEVDFYRDDCFAYCCNTETMTGAGILPGDLILARIVDEPRCGEIFLVKIRGTHELRRMFLNGTQVILMAENPALKPQNFKLEEIQIIAQYLGVHRLAGYDG